jgi:2-C-methyl-D-erythritol 2,4-cyclodiphosphate synthase
MAGNAAAPRGAEIRTGFASDQHAFGPEQGLWLGGVELPAAPRLFGHSDGDAALHAIAGALLGAAALGDLGTIFPADERTRRGVPSAELLGGVRERLAEAGWRPASVDLTIRAGRPSIGAVLPAMREAIAGLLGLDVGEVSVKASTGNLSGDVGGGRVVAADAIATIVRSSATP